MNKKFLLSLIIGIGISGFAHSSEYVKCGKTAGDITTGDNANCWSCGATCVARLDSEGKMTVSGSGTVDPAKIVYEDSYDSKGNRNYHYESPWKLQKNNITSLVIDEGITDIGYRLWSYYSKITDIKLPNSLETINYGAFQGTGISTITFPDSVTSIAEFNAGSGTLKNIIFEGNDLPNIAGAFLVDYKRNVLITFNGGEKELNQLVEVLKKAAVGSKPFTGATLKQMNTDGTYSLYNGDDGKYIETYNANGTIYTPSSYTVATATERVNKIGGCEEVKCSLKIWFK